MVIAAILKACRRLVCLRRGHDWNLHLPARVVDGVYFPPTVFCGRCGKPGEGNYEWRALEGRLEG